MYPHLQEEQSKPRPSIPVAVPPPGSAPVRPIGPAYQHYYGQQGSMQFQPPHHGLGGWHTGLCHCFDDPANCMITGLCPCITFGQIAEIVDMGETSCGSSGAMYGFLLGFTGLACLYSCSYRSKLRARYDLEEAPFADCLVHFCCETCALGQEYRELKRRGFDMGIGIPQSEHSNSNGRPFEPGRLGSKHGSAKAWDHICTVHSSRYDQMMIMMTMKNLKLVFPLV